MVEAYLCVGGPYDGEYWSASGDVCTGYFTDAEGHPQQMQYHRITWIGQHRGFHLWVADGIEGDEIMTRFIAAYHAHAACRTMQADLQAQAAALDAASFAGKVLDLCWEETAPGQYTCRVDGVCFGTVDAQQEPDGWYTVRTTQTEALHDRVQGIPQAKAVLEQYAVAQHISQVVLHAIQWGPG